ncbi:helix-turn-helix transcriptional regulator [Mesorhizobium carmichaelinearum]|uniref:helix-turn-helix transcriptional regulator n=1 Tax=Mesorhizobium carmichaelinearum TaxID=1208188 RepID=UPI000BA34E43|nr:AlpA family phage regulatory protein [Mesorhizobium carmichaelinearum]
MNNDFIGGDQPQRFLRRRDVQALTGLPTSTLYQMMSNGDFPRPIRLSPRIVGWISKEVADWQKARIAARDEVAA